MSYIDVMEGELYCQILSKSLGPFAYMHLMAKSHGGAYKMLQVHVKLLYFETFLDIAVVLHAHPHLGLVAYLALMTLPSLRADLVYLCPAWSSFRGSLNLRSILIKRHVHS